MRINLLTPYEDLGEKMAEQNEKKKTSLLVKVFGVILALGFIQAISDIVATSNGSATSGAPASESKPTVKVDPKVDAVKNLELKYQWGEEQRLKNLFKLIYKVLTIIK